MEKQDKRFGRVLGILRPLFWWLLLVLVLYGIRTHQRLMEQTRLVYSISLDGQPFPYPVSVTVDGQPFGNGDKLSLFSHQFQINCSKTGSFATNLFIWYGQHDLGDIRLKRSIGTFLVQSSPMAQHITVTGPEFSTVLTNNSSFPVPTDQYHVEARYSRVTEFQDVSVYPSQTAMCIFSPQFGALHLTCNHEGAMYQLQDSKGQYMDGGSLPATVAELPAGSYQLTVTHHNHQLQRSIFVGAGTTNDVPFEFQYGSANLETDPTGASVEDDQGRQWGTTPLTLPELPVGTWQLTLRHNGYESLLVSLQVTADKTTTFSTNLVSVNYVSAMQSARQFMATADYYRALSALSDALAAKPDDVDATALQNQARGLQSIEQAKILGKQGDYVGADKELMAALQELPGNDEAIQLMGKFQQHEPEQLDREKTERLNRPQRYFDDCCTEHPEMAAFEKHDFKTGKSLSEVEHAIVLALSSNEPRFTIVRDSSPEKNICGIEADQEIQSFLGAGTIKGKRQCIIVCGQITDTQTEVIFKIIEYKAQSSIKFSIGSLLNMATPSSAEYIPLNPATETNDKLKAQIQEGSTNVTARIQQAISANTDNTAGQISP